MSFINAQMWQVTGLIYHLTTTHLPSHLQPAKPAEPTVVVPVVDSARMAPGEFTDVEVKRKKDRGYLPKKPKSALGIEVPASDLQQAPVDHTGAYDCPFCMLSYTKKVFDAVR